MKKTKDVLDILKEVSFGDLRKNWFFFKFKYPKIILLCVSVIIAYQIFGNTDVKVWLEGLNGLSYAGIFIAGLFYTFGFTSPFALGFFIIANPQNIYFAALIGGLGAFVGDMLIFEFIKLSFTDEFNELKRERMISKVRKNVKEVVVNKLHLKRFSKMFFYFTAAVVIASPLPDEVGVSMFAGMTKIKTKTLGIISVVMNTLGILIIFAIS